MEKPRVTKKQMESIHPYIPDAYEKLEQGRITRREFIRVSTLLGMSAGVATFAAACGSGVRPRKRRLKLRRLLKKKPVEKSLPVER